MSPLAEGYRVGRRDKSAANSGTSDVCCQRCRKKVGGIRLKRNNRSNSDIRWPVVNWQAIDNEPDTGHLSPG
jgi:hypothetical protein